MRIRKTGILFFLESGILLTVCLSLSPLFARRNEIAVLPFRITGNPDPLRMQSSELPGLYQEATHFLFESHRDYPLQSLSATAAALKDIRWNQDSVLDEKRSAQICIYTDSSHFLAGSAHFGTDNSLIVEMVVYSCAAHSVVGRSRRSGRVSAMQRLLRTAVVESTDFARARAHANEGTAGGAVDVVAVIDFSGSMAGVLPEIVTSLGAVRNRLPAGSRLAALSLEGREINALPFSDQWGRTIDALKAKRGAGETSVQTLRSALIKIEEERHWRGARKALIFSDAATGGQRQTELESRIRRLIDRGIEVHLFCMPSQSQADRLEWLRLSRALRLEDPSVLYGRRVGFLEGFSIFLIQSGARFYRADRDVTTEIRGASLNVQDLTPVETIRFEASTLNLNDLPESYAKAENLRFDRHLGPVISGIEKKVEEAVLSGTTAETAKYAALLRNQGASFWARFRDTSIYDSLKDSSGRTAYVGLSLRPSSDPGERLENDPDVFYIREQSRVPRLFIASWADLLRLPTGSIDEEDVWFFLSEIRDVKDVGGGHDIRE